MKLLVGIIRKDNFSCACEDTSWFPSRNLPFKLVLKADSGNTFKLNLYRYKYGGCSLMAERVVVASDFAKLPVAPGLERGQEEFADFVLCGIAGKIRKARVRFSPSTLSIRKLARRQERW